MKSANETSLGVPTRAEQRAARTAESQTRPAAPRPPAPPDARAEPEGRLALRRPRRAVPPLERRAASLDDEPRTGVVRKADPAAWRCLEGTQPARSLRATARRDASESKVTIVQLAADGELLRQNGPDAWLPEAGDFMHRMSTLLGRSLGFAGCRSLCLSSPSAVLSVSEVGASKVVAVSGPARSMLNVLRRAGFE